VGILLPCHTSLWLAPNVEIVESSTSVEAVKVSDAPDTPDDAPKPKRRPLPLTETLVLDIVDYLLENEGYGYSTQISSYMVDYKPRRYTSREVVGILRNRPCFRHAQAKDRKGGIRWFKKATKTVPKNEVFTTKCGNSSGDRFSAPLKPWNL